MDYFAIKLDGKTLCLLCIEYMYAKRIQYVIDITLLSIYHNHPI